MEPNFILSSKNKRKLSLNGFLYVKDKEIREKTYWRCQNFITTHCKSRVTTVNDIVEKQLGEHNHAGNSAKVSAEQILEKVRDDAQNTRDSAHYIISTASVRIDNSVSALLPSVDSMKRTIRNIRQRHVAGPVLPSTRQNIEFPEIYRMTESNQPFLLFDSGPVADRILIFSTQRNLHLLARSTDWYSDGTFKTVPTIYEQLYTIHGLRNNVSIPLVYALLPNKSQRCYREFLSALKDLEASLNPSTVMIDFEQAMIGALDAEFPQTAKRGCFFHFCQCLYRNIQLTGHKVEYDTNPDFALRIRMLSALAFVPLELVETFFNKYCEENILPAHAQDILYYFEDTWIGRPDRGNRRRPPRFPLRLWNCYETVLQGLPKTNNSIEGWHHGFQSQIAAQHPNIWKFISAIKREQSLNELRIEQYISGQLPPVGRRKYKDSAERLARVVRNFEPNTNEMEYLRGIAHNIAF